MNTEPNLAQIAHDIERCNDSQRRLDEHLTSLDERDPAAPSALPGWTLGHVLTHIARNADSTLRMAAGLPQYWMAGESRTADIELGAPRAWVTQVDDVAASGAAVGRCLTQIDDWTGVIHGMITDRPKSMLPIVRRREIEVHRIDLNLGYGFADLPSDFVRTETRLLEMTWQARQPMGMTPLPAAVRERPEYERLAWLFGRIVIEGVAPAGVV